MKYMLLLYGNTSQAARFAPEERSAARQSWFDLLADMKAAGVYLSNYGLAPVTDATTVRVRNDETVTTDGPFAETPEQAGQKRPIHRGYTPIVPTPYQSGRKPVEDEVFSPSGKVVEDKAAFQNQQLVGNVDDSPSRFLSFSCRVSLARQADYCASECQTEQIIGTVPV